MHIVWYNVYKWRHTLYSFNTLSRVLNFFNLLGVYTDFDFR